MFVTGIKRQRGISMIELMVGMLLGILLIGGAISIYLASKRSYVEVEQVSALAENARFAEQIMADSLRHVGFYGEVPVNRIEKDSDLSAVTGDCTGNAAAYDINNYLFAAVATSGTAIGCVTDAVPLTEVLVIKSAVPQPYSDGPRVSLDPNDPTQGDGTIDTPTGLQADKTYVMTNNVLGVLFDGADTPPSITTGGRVPGGTAWEYRYEVYYVQQAASADESPYLSRKVLRWDGSAMKLETEQLVEGVEDMRLRFGFDSSGNGEVDRYANIASVTSLDGVQSVEVTLLIRSATEDVQYTDEKTYTLAGDPVTPKDIDSKMAPYRRLVSFASISLRNPKFLVRGGAG
jgi:type IV pilus assembly protein PilW